MKKNFLNFRASTNVKNLIGKDLVTDQITAVFELVKNSYDADATKVTIEFYNLKDDTSKLIIKDNGTGMDLNDIENKWMIIGTDSKKDKQYSEKLERPLNGDKGIGRFSVDRLGKKLTLRSIKENSRERISMHFDWSLFENEYANLDSINFPYFIKNINKNLQGVTLEIENLNDIWIKDDINKLVKNLRNFRTPFDIEDNFEILVYTPDYYDEWIPINPFKLEEMSPLWVRTEITKDNPDLINIFIKRDGIEYTETHPNKYDFGPVLAEIYFFDQSAKLKFFNRMGSRVREFGNIRLYRDNFRIHPYGESWNDWLELDRRQLQKWRGRIGTRDLIGFIQITKRHNEKIEVLTNRQGLKQNKSYEELREFIIYYNIEVLEKYYFKKPKNETFTKSRKNVDIAVESLRKVTKEIQKTSPETAKKLREITGVVQQSQKEQTKFVKNQEELINVYKRVASKEVLLHQIIHQALIRITKVKTVSSSQKRKIEQNRYKNITELKNDTMDTLVKVDNLTEDAKEYLMNVRDHLIKKRNKENINLNDFIKSLLNTFQQDFKEENIELKINIPEDLILKIDKMDLETILENFISNSLKSLKKVNDRSRKIAVKVIKHLNYIVLSIKDNGIGIPEHLRDRIFDPFFTTTGGFGMGLAIIDEIVKEYNGELSLGLNDKVGAEFVIKFRR